MTLPLDRVGVRRGLLTGDATAWVLSPQALAFGPVLRRSGLAGACTIAAQVADATPAVIDGVRVAEVRARLQVAGAAIAMVSRKIRAKARKLAAHLLEASEEDIEWELGRFYIRSAPDRGVTIQECAMAAYSNMPDGMEPGLENTAYYDPPNLTWPFAVYIVTVEVDPETGVWDVLKMVAVDDCGVRINPMIVEGQIMGGLTEAYAMASMQFITFDADGNCVGSNYMDYLLPTAWETPGFELHSEVVTPCPHHPIGAKGIGECAAVGGPAAFVNAVMDALGETGVRNIDMPLLPDRVWEALTYRRDVSGFPPVRQD